MRTLYQLVAVALALSAFGLTRTHAQGGSPYTITPVKLPDGYSITPSSAFVMDGPIPLRINNNSVIIGRARKPIGGGEPGVIYDTLSFRLSGGSLTDLGPISVSDINDYDHIVGERTGTACDFVLLRGGASVIPERLGVCTRPSSVNNTDQVVGTAEMGGGTGVYHAFLYTDGKMLDIGGLLGVNTRSSGEDVNNFGHVVGWFMANREQAFLFKDGVVTPLAPELPSSVATSINDSGQIAGYAGSVPTAFLYSDGVMKSLGTLPGAVWSVARSINNRGQVVGLTYDTIFVPSRAFLYEGGAMVDLNALLPPGSGWKLVEATDINDRGQIVGLGIKDGKEEAFLLSPASEMTPSLMTEGESGQAIALDSVTMQGGPFSLDNDHNFSSDRRTRIMLFARNVDLQPGEGATAVTVEARDGQHRIYNLPVESVVQNVRFNWLTQVVVRLPDELRGAGDILVSLRVHNAVSNSARLTILP